jgi:hydrogenase maturation protease
MEKSAVEGEVLVIGLGNPLLGDDSVGLRTAEAIRPLLATRPEIDVSEDFDGGLRLMERMIGYRRVVIIDAITAGAAPGSVFTLQPGGPATRRSAASHGIDLLTALALGRHSGAELPANEHIVLIGIQAGDVLTFGEDLSPEVEAAIPRAMELAIGLVDAEGDRR